MSVVRSWTRIIPWFLLLLATSTTAYGLQLTAAAIVETTATTATHMLLITGLDTTTGDRVLVQCATTSDRIAIGAIVVELAHVEDIATQFCSDSVAPVPRQESLY